MTRSHTSAVAAAAVAAGAAVWLGMPRAVPPAGMGRIGLAWSNSEPEWVGLAVTGIEGSTDLVHWAELAVRPYAVGETVVWLTNRPEREFYRAFNRWEKAD